MTKATKADAVSIQMPQEMMNPAAFLHLDGDWDLEFLKSGSNLFEFKQPLKWAADITNTGDALLVTGTVEGAAVCQCSRCLEDATISLVGDIEGYFLVNPEEGAPEDMEGDEFDILPDDRKIDLAPLMSSALILDAPQIPLCDEECKGLCPRCGANLNEGQCDCVPDEPDASQSPFAVLKDMGFGS